MLSVFTEVCVLSVLSVCVLTAVCVCVSVCVCARTCSVLYALALCLPSVLYISNLVC